MNRFLVLVAVSLAFCSTASAIRCYQCSGTVIGNCGDALNIFLETVQYSDASPEMPGWVECPAEATGCLRTQIEITNGPDTGNPISHNVSRGCNTGGVVPPVACGTPTTTAGPSGIFTTTTVCSHIGPMSNGELPRYNCYRCEDSGPTATACAAVPFVETGLAYTCTNRGMSCVTRKRQEGAVAATVSRRCAESAMETDCTYEIAGNVRSSICYCNSDMCNKENIPVEAPLPENTTMPPSSEDTTVAIPATTAPQSSDQPTVPPAPEDTTIASNTTRDPENPETTTAGAASVFASVILVSLGALSLRL